MRTLCRSISRITVLLFFLSGCATVHYDVGLKAVEISAQEKYRGQNIIKGEEDISKYYFEDEIVKIVWTPSTSGGNNIFGILFVLTNKSDHTVRILWNEARFIDMQGKNLRVMSVESYKLLGPRLCPANSQSNSVVNSNETIKEGVTPFFCSERHNPTLLIDLFPTTLPIEELQKKYIGKTIQVILPLQIENKVDEYYFTFEVLRIFK